MNGTAELAIFSLKQGISVVHCVKIRILFSCKTTVHFGKGIGKTVFHGERRIVLQDISPPIFSNLINVVVKNNYFPIRL